MKFMSNEEGRCPICNSQMIEYFGMELEDTAVYYPWHCPDCDTDGKEWYYVNFSEVRSNDDHIGDVEGICPDCGSEIEYGTAEPEGNSLGYEYFCPECENSGREWYDLDFDSHTIDGHEGESIEVENKKVENVSPNVIEYFGMQDNTDEKYKSAVDKEYQVLRKKYPDKEMILNDDFGTYLGTEKAKPIEKGKYITVYENKKQEGLTTNYGGQDLREPVAQVKKDFEDIVNTYNAKANKKVERNGEDNDVEYKGKTVSALGKKAFIVKFQLNEIGGLLTGGYEIVYWGTFVDFNKVATKDYAYGRIVYKLNKQNKLGTPKQEYDTVEEFINKINNINVDELITEAIDYKNDRYTATTSEDTEDDRAYYGKNMTKRDKVRSLNQAKRNLNRIGKDPRVTQGQAVDQISFDSALDTDFAYYKHNKDMAKIDKAQGNDFWADEHNKTAKQFADKIRAKHKKQEAVSKDVDIIWTNGFTLDKLKDDIKNDFDGIKETVDICDIEDREQGTSVYLAKYEGNLYLTLSKHNKDDYDDDFENTATVYVNKDKIANSNEAEFKKYILYLYNYLLGLDKPIKLGESSEDIEDNEEENDIDFDDTISLLDIALKEIPTIGVEDWGKDDELLFTADTKVMFENLKNYEEEIPKYYYDNASNYDWSNGIDSYLEEIKGVDLNSGDSDNTYNWNAPLTHDVEFTMYEADDGCYFKGSIHRAGDVRGNYTTEFLLKFNNKDDCLETLFDTCSGNCYRNVTVDGVDYTVSPHFFNEYVDIWNSETQESYDDVYCDCIERLREIIAENKNSEE